MATIRPIVSKHTGKVTYEVQIRLKGQKPITKTFKKKALATRWASQKESEIHAGKYFDSSVADKSLLSTYITKYRDEVTPVEKAATSHSADTARLNRLKEWFEHRMVSEVTPEKVFEYAHERITIHKLSSDAIRKELQLLSKVFVAMNSRWRVPSRNPVQAARASLKDNGILLPGNRRERRLTDAQYNALITFRHKRQTVISKLVEWLLETAMRRGEALKVKHAHINRDEMTVYMPETKTDYKTGRKGRVIPLTDRALAIADELPEREDELLFGLTPRSADQAFARLITKANASTLKDNPIEDFTLHDLRHEATSRLFERGVLDIQEVALITGHDDWRSLKRYTHPKASDIGEKMRRA